MKDSLPTIWEAEPHTIVKHRILRRYLEAWFPILTQQSEILRGQFGSLDRREILFIDGFAGPGEYHAGEKGSPLIAIEAVVNHRIRFPMPVQLLFIEHRDDRYVHLSKLISEQSHFFGGSQNLRDILMRCGDCDVELNLLLDEFESRNVKFGPALAFLDQFGYGAVSMDLIRRILSYPQCEVFTYMSYKEMNRWITDPNKEVAFDRAFGGGEWKICKDLPEKSRREKLLILYKDALKQRAGAKYVVSFLMFDRTDRPLYWLIFCTNNLRGIEEMKKAMWAVDKTGDFRFSDREDPAQLTLLDQAFDDDWLADIIQDAFVDKVVTVGEVKEFVLAHTPCYLFKSALRLLEKDKRLRAIDPPVGRRPGTYPDESLRVEILGGLFYKG